MRLELAVTVLVTCYCRELTYLTVLLLYVRDLLTFQFYHLSKLTWRWTATIRIQSRPQYAFVSLMTNDFVINSPSFAYQMLSSLLQIISLFSDSHLRLRLRKTCQPLQSCLHVHAPPPTPAVVLLSLDYCSSENSLKRTTKRYPPVFLYLIFLTYLIFT